MWRTASTLVAIVLLLVALGVVMLASTSPVQGEALYHDPGYFMKRQIVALVVGFVAAAGATRIDYRYWRRFAIAIGLVTVALLVMTITPGIGKSVKGSHRWLSFHGLTFQPSELAKFSAILLLAWWMSHVQRKAGELKVGIFVPGALIGVIAVLLIKEPDYGTTILISVVGGLIMFVGGSHWIHLLIAGALGASGLGLIIMQNPERMRRFTAFLDPEKYAKDDAYQMLNAIYGFVIGGVRGVGLGEGLQKRAYLPEAHTDFIFAIIGEELGLIASIATVVLFLGFFFCGLRIGFRAPDMFGKLTAFGIASVVALQAALNVAVVTGSMPTKGIPLPFISYGGSSMMISLLMVGVLVNIAKQAGDDDGIPRRKERGKRI